jgi:hypothetical protein
VEDTLEPCPIVLMEGVCPPPCRFKVRLRGPNTRWTACPLSSISRRSAATCRHLFGALIRYLDRDEKSLACGRTKCQHSWQISCAAASNVETMLGIRHGGCSRFTHRLNMAGSTLGIGCVSEDMEVIRGAQLRAPVSVHRWCDSGTLALTGLTSRNQLSFP